MLRIQQGNQERYVWPVHLPGWLALGWRVAGPSTKAEAALPQHEMAPAPAAALESAPESTAGRGKRGRRRKEEEAQSPAAAEVNPAATGADAEQQTEADSDSSAGPEPAEDFTADRAVALSAFPDDLFSDPLI
jgi:hypothetical protein